MIPELMALLAEPDDYVVCCHDGELFIVRADEKPATAEARLEPETPAARGRDPGTQGAPHGIDSSATLG